jgi:hypothetical protein
MCKTSQLPPLSCPTRFYLDAVITKVGIVLDGALPIPEEAKAFQEEFGGELIRL